MSKKTQDQAADYVDSALEGKNGVDISKPPTDPTNEKNYEQSQGMSPAEAKDFEEEVKNDFSGE